MAFFDRPSPDRPSSDQPRRPARRRIAILARLFAAVIVFPIILGIIVAAILINTPAAKARLLRIIQDKASQTLNTTVRLENFDIHLATLSADLYGLTIDGAAPHPTPPLLQVRHANVGIRIVSFFSGTWYFSNIRIDDPVAHIYVDKNGISNIPALQSSGNSNTSIFDLGIRHAVLTNGSVFYNDQPRAIALDLHDVEFNSAFNDILKKYSGSLAYSDGRLTYAGTQPPPHTLSVQFDVTPTTLHLSPAKIQCGNSNLVLNATVSNFNAPTVEAKYNAVLDGRQFAGILHNPSIPDGLVAVSGSAHYQFSRNQSLLQSIAVDGDLTSNRLVARMPSFQAQVSNIVAHYSLANSNATLRDFRAGLLGGVVTLRGTMNDISGDNQRAKFDAVLRGISLAQTKRSLGKAASGGPVAVTGTLNGTATAAWGKTFNDLVARTDATINANVASVANPNAQHAALVPAVAPSQPPGDSSTVPVEGAIHATYNAATQQLAVERSYFHTPQTNLELNGTVSHRSSLNIQLQADDLREVEAIADLFRSPSPDQPSPQPLGLAGSATFHGVVSGTTSAPHISGELAAHDLQVHGSSWKLVRAGVDASPSQVSLKDAELEPATKGRIAFDASAHLDNWTFSQSSPVEVQLNASQIDAADIQHIANLQIPVSGTLAAIVAMHGSLLNPIGSGNVTLTGAAAYGEPVTSAKVAFTGSGDQVRAIVSVIAPAGAIDANITASPNQKTYTAQLSSSGIHLDKLQQLQSGSIKPTGIVAIDAKGQGSFDNPQLDANLRIPALVVKEQTISDIRIHANLANHLATAQLTSSAVNTSITANAKVALTGDYLADATLDTQGIPIAPLLATYFPDQAANISGQTELHATLHGPLKNMQQLEAHATIPVLKLAYGSNVQLAATAPIHVDYKNATISVQRSAIKGTDTDLQFEATIPTTGTAPTAMLLLGTIDLHLAQLFDPDLRTTGQIKFNVNSYGAPDGAEIAGAINIVDASLAYPDLPVGLQHCNGSLSLTKDRINISKFQGQLGGGTLTAQGGVVLRPSIQFNLGLSARNVRMLYPQGMRENVNATLRFTGSTASALLGGTVNVTDLSFTPAFDIAGFISQVSGGVAAPPTQGFTRNVALNLAVQSSSSVNLVSRTVSVGGTANLQVRGTLDRPVILGRANLSGGDIILNGTRYVLTGGTIQFVNPSVTQPIVNLTITTSIQQYNISLRFEGPVDQLRTQYTSDPALPQADIIHLLAFGQTTEASAANGTPANQAAETLVANQVSSQLTSRISKVAGISQLSINPVLAGGSQQGPAGATITVQQRITSNLFVTFSSNVTTTQGQTIQGQYQVSPRVAISGTRDPNGGFAVDALIKKSW